MHQSLNFYPFDFIVSICYISQKGRFMKTTIFTLLLLASCNRTEYMNIVRNFEPNDIITQTVGNPIISERLSYYYSHRLSEHSESNHYEIIYSGKTSDGIKILYREYTNDLIRPAFSQELTYDVASGDTIAFRKYKMVVVGFDKNSISCRIISSNFSDKKQGRHDIAVSLMEK